MNILRSWGWNAFALVFLAACSNGGSSSAPVPAARIANPQQEAQGMIPALTTGPVIKDITYIFPRQTQTFKIKGSGFGTQSPYNGDNNYLKVGDVTGNWAAGFGGPAELDAVHLNVTSWTDSEIIIAGFTGGYGSNNWTLYSGDAILVQVWNPQTQLGAAKHKATVR